MFKVQCSRSEKSCNVEPGTLNLEHPCAFTSPGSPFGLHCIVGFPLIMNNPDSEFLPLAPAKVSQLLWLPPKDRICISSRLNFLTNAFRS